MNEVCNLSAEQQTALGAPVSSDSRRAAHDDRVGLGRHRRVVEYIARCATSAREPRRLVARRSTRGRYASRNPNKGAKLVLLAPAYLRDAGQQRRRSPAQGVRVQRATHADFTANWERQVGCPNQYEPRPTAVLARDARVRSRRRVVGARLRRAPNPTTVLRQGGVERMQTPTLMVAGIHDKQIVPELVRDYFADLGAQNRCCSISAAPHITRCGRPPLLLFPRVARGAEAGTVEAGTRRRSPRY